VGVPPTPSISVELAHETAMQQSEAAAADLQGLATSLREQGLARVDVELATGDPADAILDAIERRAVDVAVMATHGRGGLGRLLLGSVADAVSRQSERAALLLVRPPTDD
jgi:nucleotide-binding universal stress UspA family protein